MHYWMLHPFASIIAIALGFSVQFARADESFGELELRDIAAPIAEGKCETACETTDWSIRPDNLTEATAVLLRKEETVFVVVGISPLNCGAGRCTVAFVLRSRDELIAIWSEAGSDRISSLQQDEVPSLDLRATLPRVSLSEFKNSDANIGNTGVIVSTELSSLDVLHGAEIPKMGLNTTDVANIAAKILIGYPYGQSESEVHGRIVNVTYASVVPCAEGPAWKVTVHVPANGRDDAIDGTLAINDFDGKLICSNLPFLDGVDVAELPLPVSAQPKAGSETAPAASPAEATSLTSAVHVADTLPGLLQQIEVRYSKAEILLGAERANELAQIKTLLYQLANDYPASNEALSLALGDKVGSIDPVALDAELAAVETLKPELTVTPVAAPIVAALSNCFPRTNQHEGSGDTSARITIQVDLDAEGRIIGMPNMIEPAKPDDVARKLFQSSLIALDRCAELKTLKLPADIEMSLTSFGVETAVLQLAEPPAIKVPSIAAEDPLEVAPEPVWAIADNVTEKVLDLKRPDIAELQVRLGLLGFDPNGVDGIIGRGLRQAINDWQTARSIPPSGYLDERQYVAITAETQEAFPSWIAEGTNADVLATASKPPKIEANPSTERAKSPKLKKDCISFEGVTTCL